MRRVLVTRPAPLAGRTARRLREMGFTPVVMPLSETRPLDVDPADIPADARAIAATSANAILNAPRDLVRKLVPVPCFAVGSATAAAARAAGFRSVTEGPGNAAGLARMLAADGGAAPIVYFCGRVRRPDFEAALAAAGTKPVVVETYDTMAIRPDAGQAAAIGGDALEAALVYSAGAAAALHELAGRPECSRSFQDTAFFCLSKRIAGCLKAAAGRKILVAAEPTEEALLSLLANPGGRLNHASSFLEPMV